MVTQEIPINFKILEWARNQANLSPNRAAIKAGLKDLKARGNKEGLTSTLRLQRWEQGIETPSLPQLEKIANAYKRPLLTFFLPEPPIQQTRLQDFRTVAHKTLDSESFSPEFSALLRRVEALQLNIHDLMLDLKSEPVTFVSSFTLETKPLEVVERIRKFIGFTFKDQQKAGSRVLSDIRERIENKGIFVLTEGNLGSHHTNIEPEVFRGLSISDIIAPFIVINPNDAKSAMIFTLVHELCHLGLGDTGISNWTSIETNVKTTPLKNELFCDQVAADFLAPRDILLKEWEKYNSAYTSDESIEKISTIFNVSRIVIARRLLDFNEITKEYYWELFNIYQEEWQHRNTNMKKSVVPYKIRVKYRLGNRLINTVIGAATKGKISELDASRILNVKINNFSQIL
jgi:Zn-dependent peptidase ImmA (M78 family)/transcriptional regulator with XRE-family HTH domain